MIDSLCVERYKEVRIVCKEMRTNLMLEEELQNLRVRNCEESKDEKVKETSEPQGGYGMASEKNIRR